jgi:hypothetical protein
VKKGSGVDDWRYTLPADAPFVPKTCVNTTVGNIPLEKRRSGTYHGAALLLAAPVCVFEHPLGRAFGGTAHRSQMMMMIFTFITNDQESQRASCESRLSYCDS